MDLGGTPLALRRHVWGRARSPDVRQAAHRLRNPSAGNPDALWTALDATEEFARALRTRAPHEASDLVRVSGPVEDHARIVGALDLAGLRRKLLLPDVVRHPPEAAHGEALCTCSTHLSAAALGTIPDVRSMSTSFMVRHREQRDLE